MAAQARGEGIMAYFSTAPLGRFGVEVDCDLSRPLDERGQTALRELFYREKLLVFHNQDFTVEQERAVVDLFGDTSSEPAGLLSLDGELVGACALAWHGDIMFVPEPYRLLSLFALDVDEESGTSTRFVNGAQAASRLPAGLRERLASMTTTAVYPGHVSRRHVSFENAASPVWPKISRPVLWPHPVTGEEILFIFELYTARIDGLPQAESDALVEELFARLYDEEHVQEHVWKNGDFVMWDNLALQHGRAELRTVRRRTLRRMTAGSGKPFFAQCPQIVPADPGFVAWTKGEATVSAAMPEDAATLEFRLDAA
jgi:taurine dioxygenase